MDDAMVQPEEMARAVIVTNIPMSPQAETEAALATAFGGFGAIERQILQQSGEGSSQQHAVIIFGDALVAGAAASYAGKILGQDVDTILASALSGAEGELVGEEEEEDVGADAGGSESAAEKAQRRMAKLLAGGALAGKERTCVCV